MAHQGKLRVYLFVERTRALGPFERAALWLQGCNRRCPGCMSAESRPLDGGTLYDTEEILHRILAIRGIEGVTISGGEPFLQAEELAYLTAELQRAGLGVKVYTGYTLEELLALGDSPVNEALRHIDLLVDGPFVQEKTADALALRGSSNQRVLPLTDRYQGVLESVYDTPRHRVEMQMVEGQLVAIGVPTAEMLQKMSAL